MRLARGVAEGEEFLVGAHGGLQDLGGEVEEAGLDAAHQGDGPFGEAGVLGEEAGVVDEVEAGGEGELLGVVGDAGRRGGRGRGGRGRVRAWRRSPRRRRPGRRRGRGSGGRRWCWTAVRPSMVRGTVSGPVSRVRMQRIEWSGRTQRSAPSPQRMDLGQGKAADGVLDGFGDDLGGGAAGAVDDGEEDGALGVGAGLELVAGEAGGAEEAVDGLLGGVGARALAFLALARGVFGEAFDGEGQAARGREGGGVGVGEAALDEAVGDEAAQVVGGAGLHPGGDFLGEEFEEEVGHFGFLWAREPQSRKRCGRSRGNAAGQPAIARRVSGSPRDLSVDKSCRACLPPAGAIDAPARQARHDYGRRSPRIPPRPAQVCSGRPDRPTVHRTVGFSVRKGAFRASRS